MRRGTDWVTVAMLAGVAAFEMLVWALAVRNG